MVVLCYLGLCLAHGNPFPSPYPCRCSVHIVRGILREEFEDTQRTSATLLTSALHLFGLLIASWPDPSDAATEQEASYAWFPNIRETVQAIVEGTDGGDGSGPAKFSIIWLLSKLKDKHPEHAEDIYWCFNRLKEIHPDCRGKVLGVLGTSEEGKEVGQSCCCPL